MILYKYIDSKSLTCFFQQGYLSIKFTPFNEFNDPFESYGVSVDMSDDEASLLPLTIGHQLQTRAACLCLSRNPLNVLMWSHYAEHHKGFVVAIDTEKAGFEDESKCIVTASKGEMEYFGIRNERGVKVRLEDINNPDTICKMLLNKSLDWKYEEENRVIKRFDTLKKRQTDNGDLWFKEIVNMEAITGIIIGIKNENIDSIISENSILEKLVTNNTIKLYKCEFKDSEWGLKKEDYSYYNPAGKNDICNQQERFMGLNHIERIIREMKRRT